MSCAASLSSETASIALPLLVLLTNSESPTTISTDTTIAAVVSLFITTCPSNSVILGRLTTEVNVTGFSPNTNSAIFCKK